MWEPPPGESVAEAIAAYKAGVDRTLIRENLRRTPGERIDLLNDLYLFAMEVRRAGRSASGAGAGRISGLEAIQEETGPPAPATET